MIRRFFRRRSITRGFTTERRRRIDDMKKMLLAEIPLHELRRTLALTQRDMAKMLKVNQPAVSNPEQRADCTYPVCGPLSRL